ncbi:MAG TPA: SBBP repeat-containing protein, partial [Myxococcaceae bacterium]|nr:SBBP repeat-containing protein [Myxococcaceae bacterium]
WSSLRLKWSGARSVSPRGIEPTQGKSHYFLGSESTGWRTDIPHFSRVQYDEIYPGVDLVLYGNDGQLEYDLIVKPGADTKRIRLAFDGAVKEELDERGDLVISAAAGSIRQRRPFVYQDQDGVRRAIGAAYVPLSHHQFGIRLASYDQSRPLTIDPTVTFSSYLGGTDTDSGTGIALDLNGNILVCGETSSLDFPVVGAIQAGNAGLSNAFVTKLDPTGSTVLYSTYVGGTGQDRASGIAVDLSGNAYVAGRTNSTDFPVANGPFSFFRGGSFDAWFAELSPDGSQLLFSTYWGGSGNDSAFSVAVDPGGNAYLTGGTSSTDDFPVTLGAFQINNGGGTDAWVSKIDPSQVGFAAVIWSTFLGGTARDRANAIAVDTSGNTYVTGRTNSPEPDWLAPNGFQQAFGGSDDAFVVELSSDGTGLLYSSYLGGTDVDIGNAIAVDANGFIYVAGETGSTDFPTLGAFQPTYGGGTLDAFVTKIDPSMTADASLIYSTYLGGAGSGISGEDYATAVTADGTGAIYLTGVTFSDSFPVSPDAFQPALAGASDAFIAKMDLSQQGPASLIYASYFGGSGADSALGVAADGLGNAWLTGQTSSGDLPTTGDAFQSAIAGGFSDAFVTKVSDP